MKNLKKKGFTIVELVIVIAVIAVLAAVLIPTFVNLTKKANQSADIQATRQMNVVLASDKYATIEEAVAALAEAGYNALDTLTPVSTGYSFWWVEEYNSIVLLNENAEVVFASNKDAQANFEAAKAAGKAFNLKRGLPEVSANNSESVIDALRNGQSVKLDADVTIDEKIKIQKGEDITIDLNGKTLTTAVTGSSSEGDKHEYAFDNHGTLTIENGTIESRGIYNRAGATLVIGKEVTVIATDPDGGSAINVKGGTVTIDGATLIAQLGDAGDSGDTNVLAYEPSALKVEAGKVYIKNATVNAPQSGAYAIQILGGEAIIENCTVEAYRGAVYANNSTISINGGTYKQMDITNPTGHAVCAQGKAVVTISAGTIIEGASPVVYGPEVNWTDNR